MPINPIKKKDANDKFYTKPDLAKLCVNFMKMNIPNQDKYLWVEPSAGDGSFSSIVEGCLAYDLFPEGEDIIQQDWLDKTLTIGGNWLMFGNPPFGSKKDKLSDKFIEAGIRRGCSYIGFVLPNTYRKFTKQKIFPLDWKLIGSISLPSDSFLLNGDDYHVPCSFQLWAKEADVNYRTTKGKIYTKDFSFVRKDSTDANLFIFGASPSKVILPREVTKNNRGYYLTTNIPLDKVIQQLKSIDWKKYGNSSVNGGVAWFTKSEIIEIWEKHYGSK